ncbi:MAG: hypothetical protein JJ934_13310 [Pseudomonadales bacterium]|nr:hypothetical protein [Pseudomonadales bacterium]MBO6657872.1 hypothetical protein [Pseudomonadales bacterium]MBO6702424.1 hypothetical protein [Pseudomonadales bacterium]MBO7007208.1 hypothetical protein [Pseudomonadales bacterium]
MSHRKLVFLLILMVATIRIAPHPLNVTPIGAFALFCGAYLTDKRFLLLPLAALLIGDVIMGFYTPMVMVGVYAGFALSSLVGRWTMADLRTLPRFVMGVVLGAVVFYLVSNIGMWWLAYPNTFAGLLACWTEGLPFLLRTLAGDFVYAAVFFGIVEWHMKTTATTNPRDNAFAER